MVEHQYGWLSLIPSLLAIILAIATRQVYLSLILGILAGAFIINSSLLGGLFQFFNIIVDVFKDSGNTRVIIFACLVGGLLELMNKSGGFVGIGNRLSDSSLVNTKKKSLFLLYLTGIIIFIESTITILIVGTIGKVLAKKYKFSKAQLAYICDSTSAPVCIMIPVNAWGAFVLGLMEKQHVEKPIEVFISSIGHNYYAIVTLLMVLFFILSGKHFGPMKKAETDAETENMNSNSNNLMKEIEPEYYSEKRPQINFILPVLTLMLSVPFFLFLSGWEKVKDSADSLSWFQILTSGSGSIAVLVGVVTSILVTIILILIQRQAKFETVFNDLVSGSGKFINLSLLMVLAFAIGQLTSTLQTGEFIASFVMNIQSPGFLIAGVFLVSCFISFSTGTSWGTFAIMIPLCIPIAISLNLPLNLTIAAILSGGVYGDHCSPISDTTIISSLASDCSLMDHVKTQLPYALIAAGISLVLFIVI